MQLPPQLRHAIEQQTAQCNPQSLSQAATELSENYRARKPTKGKFITSEIHRLAYLATRFPATFAANHSVLTEIRRLMPDRPITSLLDLGAGPGTASWAATQVFPDLQQITLVEQDEELFQLGKSLALTGENTLLQNANWTRADLRTTNTFPTHDLVVISYALGELPQNTSNEILKTAWSSANTALAIIEPGTMVGFNQIRQIRDHLLNFDGHLIAPCPHQDECPISANDWCHFSQRVDRSSLHRRLKTCTLGH
jgi:ribosomal protein RSM22 (predicted rRNA methylase)